MDIFVYFMSLKFLLFVWLSSELDASLILIIGDLELLRDYKFEGLKSDIFDYRKWLND